MKRILTVFSLVIAVSLSGVASANKFSPKVERQYREPSITISDAVKQKSTIKKTRRPGLGSFTRRTQNRVNYRSSSQNPERQLRTSTRRYIGGRNSYARYLKSKSTDNTKKVSHLKRGRVDAAKTADTEANTR